MGNLSVVIIFFDVVNLNLIRVSVSGIFAVAIKLSLLITYKGAMMSNILLL